MDFDLSSLPSSTLGLVCAVFLVVAGLVGRWLSRRDEKADILEKNIAETEEALRLALENGMVTDAQRLSRRLNRMYAKLSRRNAC